MSRSTSAAVPRHLFRRTRRAALPATLALAGAAAAALPGTAAAQAPAGRGGSLPDSLARQVDDVFADLALDGVPGCALGIVRDGDLAYAAGYGHANLDWELPITPSTVFDIGSVSKQFTATAIHLLAAEGVLSLDDDVRRWIPEMPAYERPVTLRHLVHHTSGVRDYLTLMRLQGLDFDGLFDEDDGVAVISRQGGLNFLPGDEFLYSNSGYLLLAAVVRRATGTALGDFLEARVFAPLAMTATSVWDDRHEVVPERATGYAPRDGGGFEISHHWNFEMGGDGQVLTSIEDLVRWDANFYQPRVGGAALLEGLHRPGMLTAGDTISYAGGLTVDRYRGLRRVAHGGSWGGFRAQLTRFPDQRTTIAALCNRSDANPGRRVADVADLVLDAAFTEPPRGTVAAPPAPDPGERPDRPTWSPDPAALAEYAGSYHSAELDVTYRIEREDGELVATIPGGERLTLRPGARDEFRVQGGVTLAFVRGEGGGITGFTVDAGRVTGIGFERRGEPR